jgi:hypothetical protein
MKTKYWHVVSAFFLTLTLSFTPSLGSMAVPVSVATRHEVEYIEDSKFDDFVPEGLEWPQETLNQVHGLLEPSIYRANKLLEQLKAGGASSVTVTAGKMLNDVPEFTRYSDVQVLNHESKLSGRGAWGVEVGKSELSYSMTADWNSWLVGFKPGVCRLNWTLFNWDTWFSPDCAVISATPEQYLRVALAAYLFYTSGVTSGGGFELAMALEEISAYRLPYEVRDGVLFASDLDKGWGFADSGIPLVQPVRDGYAGYEIEIDEQDSYHFIVRTRSPTMQQVADQAHVRTYGQLSYVERWVTFSN